MPEITSRVAVFIDGSNLFFKLRSLEVNLLNLTKFDYRGFSKWLANDRPIVYCGYYVGAVRAKENLCDVAILVSSDTDLIPAIQKVKHLGKKVEYIGFLHQPSYGLKRYASFSKFITKEELEPFSWKQN